MRLTALLSFYNEQPRWLRDTILSLAGICDHLVAVDGSYPFWPSGKPRSSRNEIRAITDAARDAGLGVTIHQPTRLWPSEVAKRTFMFQLASTTAEENKDWLLVIDGDEQVTDKPDDLHQRLEQTDLHVAGIALWENHQEWNDWFEQRGTRRLFRALPNMRVVGAHFIYYADLDGEPTCLWGLQGHHEMLPFLQLDELRMWHRRDRPQVRRRDSATYYDRRDRRNLEDFTATAGER